MKLILFRILIEVCHPRVTVNMDLRGERHSICEYTYLTKLHYVKEERNQRFQGINNVLFITSVSNRMILYFLALT